MESLARDGGKDLTALMAGYVSAVLAGDIPAWLDLWAEDGVFEHPYSPPGYRKSIEGKSAIAEYMEGFPERFDVEELAIVKLIQNETGSEGFVEMKAKATAIATGRPYNQHYVGFVKVDDNGKVSLYRDFWNPLVAIEAMGGVEALTEAFHAGER